MVLGAWVARLVGSRTCWGCPLERSSLHCRTDAVQERTRNSAPCAMNGILMASNAMIHCNLARRRFLAKNAFGIGGVALAWLLKRDGLLAEPTRPELEPRRFDLTPKPTHHPAHARAMISLFMQGGPSHIDLLDPKPGMQRYNLQPFPGTIRYDNAAEASARVLASPWQFRKYGQAGIDVSELLPNLAEIVDDICVVRSMHTGVSNHGQS